MRYAKLFFTFTKNNIIREMEFRENFIIGAITDAMWVGLQVILIQTYFSFTNSISGWSKYETLGLIGIFRIIKGLFDMIFRQNLFGLPDSISLGELDYTLTKPINSLFLVSVRKQEVSTISSTIVGIILLSYAIVASKLSITIGFIVGLCVLIPLGLSVFYSLMLIFSTLSLYLIRLSSLRQYYDVISNIIRFPVDIFGQRPISVSLLMPLIIIVTLPAKIVLAKVSPSAYIVEVLLAALLFIIAYKFWNLSLRHYSSASS